MVTCDTCGAVQMIDSREGMTCNAGLQGGGYCQGTLQGAAYFAAAETQDAEPPPETAEGTPPKKRRRKSS